MTQISDDENIIKRNVFRTVFFYRKISLCFELVFSVVKFRFVVPEQIRFEHL